MKNQVKKMAKDALTIGATGVGLGVMGGVSPSAAPAIGTLGKGLGKVGGLVMVRHGMKILQEVVPKKKKGGWY
jgi:7-keto-8-aminopelargonate synthetase-like enzyme